ncbi:hypothetical protein GW17_00014156 [Ensete ventricosum]|nr:hypothetical protein GW17_00014156 [Ensete ventricosum]RZR81013.1 hypothetical protein BHM03_00007145 [Ensete ventricosum]
MLLGRYYYRLPMRTSDKSQHLLVNPRRIPGKLPITFSKLPTNSQQILDHLRRALSELPASPRLPSVSFWRTPGKPLIPSTSFRRTPGKPPIPLVWLQWVMKMESVATVADEGSAVEDGSGDYWETLAGASYTQRKSKQKSVSHVDQIVM